MRLAVALLPCCILQAATLDFGPWTPWSPRPEVLPNVTRTEATLSISSEQNPGAFGGWHREVRGIEPGHWYRLSAGYHSRGLNTFNRQVLARVEWLDSAGKRAGLPDFAVANGSTFELHVPAPSRAAKAVLQLYLAHARHASVDFNDVKFEPADVPPVRSVTIAAVNLRPAKSTSSEASVELFARTAEAIPAPVDLIVLPEGITVIGTGKTYVDVAEPAAGPTAVRLGAVARAKKSWIVAGIYEREGPVVYNTAILLDRQGKLAGKYRKVYLPSDEVERGLTPGDSYPVFETDFGKIGMMICYDVFYADPARALALAGAEIIAMPIWGGNTTLAAARSIENRVFLVSSGYDYPTRIQDPTGAIIASTSVQGSVALATVDLNKRYADPLLGDMRHRFFNEVRLDVPVK